MNAYETRIRVTDLRAGDIIPVPKHEQRWMKRDGLSLELTVQSIEPSERGVWNRIVAGERAVTPRWYLVRVQHPQVKSFAAITMKPDSVVLVRRPEERAAP